MKQLEENQQQTVFLFTKDFKDTLDDTKSCCKKKVGESGKEFYFIKADSSRQFFNPEGFPNDTNLSETYLGQQRWRYVEVKKEVFDLYKQFLSTKNSVFFRQSQRRYENE